MFKKTRFVRDVRTKRVVVPSVQYSLSQQHLGICASIALLITIVLPVIFFPLLVVKNALVSLASRSKATTLLSVFVCLRKHSNTSHLMVGRLWATLLANSPLSTIGLVGRTTIVFPAGSAKPKIKPRDWYEGLNTLTLSILPLRYGGKG